MNSEEVSGALPSARAGALRVEPPVASQAEPLVPNAGNDGPDWFEVAKAMANAIMFQRTMRGEHVIGRDGRTRMGMVDLFGCYAVDEAAREFCELAGLPFGFVEAPNEQQAFYMSVTGRSWEDWFTDRDTIIAEAGRSPGKGKVDMKHLAQAIEARRAATAKTGAVEDESAVPQGCARKEVP